MKTSKVKRLHNSALKIKKAIHEEKEAIRDYSKDAKIADPTTAKLFRHIAKEEKHQKHQPLS